MGQHYFISLGEVFIGSFWLTPLVRNEHRLDVHYNLLIPILSLSERLDFGLSFFQSSDFLFIPYIWGLLFLFPPVFPNHRGLHAKISLAIWKVFTADDQFTWDISFAWVNHCLLWHTSLTIIILLKNGLLNPEYYFHWIRKNDMLSNNLKKLNILKVVSYWGPYDVRYNILTYWRYDCWNSLKVISIWCVTLPWSIKYFINSRTNIYLNIIPT